MKKGGVKRKSKLANHNFLILGLVTVFFSSLYDCCHCALKKPSEMTNDLAESYHCQSIGVF